MELCRETCLAGRTDCHSIALSTLVLWWAGLASGSSRSGKREQERGQ